MNPVILQRPAHPDAVAALRAAGLAPLLARICAARGIAHVDQLADDLDRLHRPDGLLHAKRMAECLADCIAQRRKLLIVADYDADGATACAVGLRGLRALGADVHYLVPNRFEYGYGLTPEIVQLAHDTHRPDVLITVDNGIASVDGVAAAHALGMQVLVTDHHLPGDRLPDAWCIVNPNQPGCPFPSKALAGVGVMFYVLLALRAELKDRRALDGNGPNFAALLDLVALGTVADVVTLDDNNRRLVQQGLKRMRAGRAQPGIVALFRAAGRDPARACAADLGYALGPRLNAAGRLTDMTLGIECLTTDDPGRAARIAQELDALNRERRSIEADMQEAALAALEQAACGEEYTLSLFDPEWHQGVVGIVASRIKDRYHRPTLAFARGNDGEIKGSGRSIAGLHLRDALDLVTKRHPGLILKFGGHAAAAGLTLRETDFERFRDAFETAVRGMVSAADLERQIETDGSLVAQDMTLETATALGALPWGSGFPAPRFHDDFEVADQRVVGGKHLKLRLARAGRLVDGILFGTTETLPARIAAVYSLDVNEWQGTRRLQVCVQHWNAA